MSSKYRGPHQCGSCKPVTQSTLIPSFTHLPTLLRGHIIAGRFVVVGPKRTCAIIFHFPRQPSLGIVVVVVASRCGRAGSQRVLASASTSHPKFMCPHPAAVQHDALAALLCRLNSRLHIHVRICSNPCRISISNYLILTCEEDALHIEPWRRRSWL